MYRASLHVGITSIISNFEWQMEEKFSAIQIVFEVLMKNSNEFNPF